MFLIIFYCKFSLSVLMIINILLKAFKLICKMYWKGEKARKILFKDSQRNWALLHDTMLVIALNSFLANQNSIYHSWKSLSLRFTVFPVSWATKRSFVAVKIDDVLFFSNHSGERTYIHPPSLRVTKIQPNCGTKIIFVITWSKKFWSSRKFSKLLVY